MLDTQDYNGGMESIPRSHAEENACKDFARRLEGEDFHYYVMHADGSTQGVYDMITWARQFEAVSRIIQKTRIGDVEVSTVFLGLDHRFGDSGPPLIFETMIFGGPLNQKQDRYSTIEEAKAGHARMVKRVRR